MFLKLIFLASFLRLYSRLRASSQKVRSRPKEILLSYIYCRRSPQKFPPPRKLLPESGPCTHTYWQVGEMFVPQSEKTPLHYIYGREGANYSHPVPVLSGKWSKGSHQLSRSSMMVLISPCPFIKEISHEQD